MLRKLSSPAWAVLEYAWYPLLLFVTTPWFLHSLGVEQYGHWMLLSATVGLGGMLSAGTGAATIKAVSAGIGRATKSEVERSIRTSLAIAMVGGGALALLVFIAFWFAGSTLLPRMGDPALLRLTGVVAALLLWIEQLDNVLSSAMKGAERFGLAARAEMASKTFQILAAAIILLWRPDLPALYSTLLATAAIRLLCKAYLAWKMLELSSLRPSLTGIGATLHFAKWGWLQGAGGLLFGVADRMLVGAILGATSLTYYSIASQLAMQVHAISAAGLSVIFPRISRELESRDLASFRKVAKLGMAGNFVLSGALAAALILLGPDLLRLWIGPEAGQATARILPWLVAAYWVLALNVVPYYMLLGLGRIRFVGITVFISGVAGLATMYLTTSHFGLVGAPAGRGMYALLTLAMFFPLAGYFIAPAQRGSRP